MATGDVNNDGHLDLVIVDEQLVGDPRRVFLGDGSGNLTDLGPAAFANASVPTRAGSASAADVRALGSHCDCAVIAPYLNCECADDTSITPPSGECSGAGRP